MPDLPIWVANKTAGASNVWAPDINVLVSISLRGITASILIGVG